MRTEIILVFLIANFCYAQNFMPSGSMSLLNSYITWTNYGMQTYFTITSNFNGQLDPANAWIALGLNSEPKMSGTNAVVCVNTQSENSISHHLNVGYFSPLFNSSDPMLGLSNSNLNVVNRNLTCSFTRKNFNSLRGYFGFDSITPLHFVVAYGQGSFGYHSNRGSSMNTVVFANSSMNNTNPFTPMTTPEAPSSNLFNIIFKVLIDFFSRLFMGLF